MSPDSHTARFRERTLPSSWESLLVCESPSRLSRGKRSPFQSRTPHCCRDWAKETVSVSRWMSKGELLRS